MALLWVDVEKICVVIQESLFTRLMATNGARYQCQVSEVLLDVSECVCTDRTPAVQGKKVYTKN